MSTYFPAPAPRRDPGTGRIFVSGGQ
jgi:hypothetical protein